MAGSWSGLKMAQFVHWSHLEREGRKIKNPGRPAAKRIEDGTF
jgi:hypothetical protein